MAHSLDTLQAEAVAETVRRLRDRIAERFPERGLVRVADELLDLVGRVKDDASTVRGRIHTARVVSRVLIAAIAVGTAVALWLAVDAARGDAGPDGLDWLPLIETTINDLVFAAIAVFFLYTFPERLLRGDLLTLLHRLRSLAHIIDMHQFSKDPERLRPGFQPTEASKVVELNRDQMERYLNYCSELLSLVGKAAALCAEESRDSVVLETVRSIEELTLGMSRKIWQKISVLSS
ncbi:hypothetical protein [Nocardioides sp. SR21]|uniref:hypothetical protein n=1 Tax=Nocardioides sp. SR21 TaxID=2919501 RepID=UPI001FAA0A93|nr:hypothetical protein [Nocardioides sp. SR21]